MCCLTAQCAGLCWQQNILLIVLYIVYSIVLCTHCAAHTVLFVNIFLYIEWFTVLLVNIGPHIVLFFSIVLLSNIVLNVLMMVLMSNLTLHEFNLSYNFSEGRLSTNLSPWLLRERVQWEIEVGSSSSNTSAVGLGHGLDEYIGLGHGLGKCSIICIILTRIYIDFSWESKISLEGSCSLSC